MASTSVCVYAVEGDLLSPQLRLAAGTPSPAAITKSLEVFLAERLLRSGRNTPYVMGIVQQGEDEIAEDTLPARASCFTRMLSFGDSTQPRCAVCLVAEASNKIHDVFDSFAASLSDYCNSASSLLAAACAPDSSDAAKHAAITYLSPWYSHCVDYLTRCVRAYSNDLPAVLLAATRGAELPESAISKDDSKRFGALFYVKTCEGPWTGPIDEPFNAWAAQLQEAVDDPLELLRLCQKIKITVMHELNRTQKLLGAAMTSHHALYQCYSSLRVSRLRRLVMEMLPHEEPFDSVAMLLGHAANETASAPLESLI